MRSFGKILCSNSVSFLALSVFCTSPVIAKQATTDGSSSSEVRSSPSAGTANSDNEGLADIVVTAQKRVESAQKVPIAISVVSANALTTGGALNAADLSKAVPSLQNYANGPFNQLSIRGIGSSQINAFGDPAVSYVVDGVVQDRAANATSTFYDVERIEVLKGPQGTLFGRNATAGAVNIVTKDPEFELGGHAELEVGNYRAFNSSGAINVPVTDMLALRAAWQTNRHDGYFTNGYNDADNVAARLKLLWMPTDRIKVRISGDYFRQAGQGYADAPLPIGVNGYGASDPWNQDYYPRDGSVNNRIWGVGAQIDWDLGPVAATFIPGYRHTAQQSYYHYAGTWSYVDNISRQTTFEARLAASNPEKLTWVVGAYYFGLGQDVFNQYELQCFCANDDIFTYNTSPNYVGRDLSALDTTSYAIFGQATYEVLDAIRITGGIRYTHDKKKERGIGFVELPSIGVSLTSPNIADRSFKNVSWRIGIDADLAPRSMVYANVSTGYKAGGLNEGLNDPGYGPERLLALAAGSKNRFFDNRLQLNAEVFYWRYKGKQIATVASVPPEGNVGYFGSNIPRSNIYGFDLDGTFLVARGLKFDLSLEYLKSDTSAFTVPTTGAPFISDGQDVLRTPRWNIAAGVNYEYDLGNGGVVSSDVRVHHVSRQLLDVYEAPTDFSPATTTVDASMGYTAPDKRWTLTGYIRNIGNQEVIVGVFRPYNPGPRSSVGWGFLGAPRTFGAKLGITF